MPSISAARSQLNAGYKELKANSKASNKLVERMIDRVQPYFASLFLEDVSARVRIKGRNGHKGKLVEANLEFSLKPIKRMKESW